VVQEQRAHLAVGVDEHRLARGDVDHALVQVHRAARLVGHRLGHEGRGHIVLERGFAQGAFEHGDLVGKIQGVTVAEVDFHLRRAVFVDQCVEVQALGFAPVVDVFEQRVELVGGVDGERLATGFGPPGAADRGFQRQVRVIAALGQVELHFRRDNRLPALLGVELQHLFSTLRGDSSMGLPCLSKVSWITMAVGSIAHGTT